MSQYIFAKGQEQLAYCLHGTDISTVLCHSDKTPKDKAKGLMHFGTMDYLYEK